MFSIAVFCGARPGAREDYLAAADGFGRTLAARDIALVYGGGNIGLMGALADGALDLGGHVIGVIPDFLREREVCHAGLAETLVVDDLFERKALMIERSDAFVALPGGIGTYDEILEVIAWRQLRQLRQPIGILNVAGYFDPWLAALRHGVDEGFISDADLDALIVERDPELLIDLLIEAAQA